MMRLTAILVALMAMMLAGCESAGTAQKGSLGDTGIRVSGSIEAGGSGAAR